MSSYVVWSAASSATFGLLTFATVRWWDRHVTREAHEAAQQAEAVEAAALRQKDVERQVVSEIARSERRYRALAGAGASALWRSCVTGIWTTVQGWEALTGQPDIKVIGAKLAWLQALHPEDRQVAADAWTAAVATGEPVQADFRVRTSDKADWRWCRARGVAVREEPEAGDAEGRIVEWLGVIYDIDIQRRSDERWRLLAMEVNHRAKNTLAVVQTLVSMGGGADRQASEQLVSRIRALARAHDLLAARDWRAADLRTVAEAELATFEFAPNSPAFVLTGPLVPLGASAVQPLSMMLHELATNAVKHGSLASGGHVQVSWTIDEVDVRLDWTESSESAEVTTPTSRSFGTRVIDSIVRMQLGGAIDRRWLPSGLVCSICIPLARLQTPTESGSDIAPPPPLPVAAQ